MLSETRRELTAFMTASGKTQRQISKEIGFSTAVISQFLSGTYAGDNEEVERSVKRYLSVGKERLNIVKNTVFLESLYNTREALVICSYAHRRNEIALLCGDAGAGKTTALRFYEKNNVGVIMVTANACTTTAVAILGLICEKLGRPAPGRRAQLMKLLVQQLTDTNRLIIIDEADHLSLDALQAVRNLNDEAGVGVVLSGNNKLYKQMKDSRRGYEFDQLRTRIVLRKKIYNEYTLEEIQGIFPGADEGSVAFLLRMAQAESLRTACKMYEIAGESAGSNGCVTLSLLKKVQQQLFSDASF